MSVGDTAHRIDEWPTYLAEHRTVLKIVVEGAEAVPELKAVADWITRSNDDDGVAHALAHFIP